MRTIGVVTSSRADYGIYRPILSTIAADPSLALSIVATGMHLSVDHGYSVDEIKRDGFEVFATVPSSEPTDTPEGLLQSVGGEISGFADLFRGWRPDILMVLGDRFDMYPAALAALPFRIPVAHVHGGEITLGAIDDALRHSITKLAHLHFVSTAEYARRVAQLGEEEWRITISGAPSLDNISNLALPDKDDVAKHFGWDPSARPLLITFHAATLESERTEDQISALLGALETRSEQIVFTAPNADPGGRAISAAIKAFVSHRPNAQFAINLGTSMYFGLMRVAAAMIGNSSSGIIEAASFALPVVNIGTRQQGRVRGANVIDVGTSRAEIQKGIVAGTNQAFRVALSKMKNPYYCGGAAGMIVNVLKNVVLGDGLLRKSFVDLPASGL